MTTKKVIRATTMPDEVLLVRANVLHGIATEDLAAITARWPGFTLARLDAILATIQTAEALPQDDDVMADIGVLTADTNAHLALGYEQLQQLDLSAQSAWPNDEARQQVFGQKKWPAARNDQEKMINALERAHQMATDGDYSARLGLQGFTPEMADGLLATRTALHATNLIQEKAKAKRPVTTQDRILALNAVHRDMADINLKTKAVFLNNAAKLKQYQLYPPGTDATTTVALVVYKAGTTEPVAGATVALSAAIFQPAAVTNAQGKANFSTTAGDVPDAVDISVSHPTEGNASYAGLTIVKGGKVEHVLEVPHEDGEG